MIEKYMLEQEAIGARIATQLFDIAAETKDATVYACATLMSRDPMDWQRVVVELAKAQAETLKITMDTLGGMVARCSDATVLVRDVMPDIDLSDGQVVATGDWPATERTVVELSRVVYFRDFLRSFWRRLTKR
jgi:hypothetical protein